MSLHYLASERGVEAQTQIGRLHIRFLFSGECAQQPEIRGAGLFVPAVRENFVVRRQQALVNNLGISLPDIFKDVVELFKQPARRPEIPVEGNIFAAPPRPFGARPFYVLAEKRQVRVAEAVDGLLLVSHDKKRVVKIAFGVRRRPHGFDQLVLQRVGVLKFVYHDMFESALIGGGRFKHLARAAYEVG